MTCTARIIPFRGNPTIDCELDHNAHDMPGGRDVQHEGALRDYAYPGSVTKISWMESDRRTFRGEFIPCDWPSCILPIHHRGSHESGL